ncbi:Ig-like domain-containing protein [Yersinia proxima]|uniref:Ig-like domain-containing protein n=1 Tax=Yersinia proxima TaxID=2890316 RepID=UPI001D0F95C2|nr:Ig-like domain-containing protein [Yersinia proxima]
MTILKDGHNILAEGETLTLGTTSGALANSIESNSATATLMNADTFVPGASILFSVNGNALFSNGFNFISADTNVFGQARVDFTNTVAQTVNVTALYGNTLSATETSIFTQSETDPKPVLEGEVMTNKVPADGKSQNEVLYTLVDRQTNQPMAGEYMFFTATGSAQLGSAHGYTDSSGQFTLVISNEVAESVTVIARLASDPEVNSVLSVAFTEAIIEPDYQLTADILIDNEQANGLAQNLVRFILLDGRTGYGIHGETLQISQSGGAVLPGSGSTDNNGYLDVPLTSNIAQVITVSAKLEKKPLIIFSVQVTFSSEYPPGYPIELGTHTINRAGSPFVAISHIMKPYNVIKGHKYRVTFSNQSALGALSSCDGQYFFDPEYNDCNLMSADHYTVITPLTEFISLRDQSGAFSLSPYYYYDPSAVRPSVNVTVTDYGPVQ